MAVSETRPGTERHDFPRGSLVWSEVNFRTLDPGIGEMPPPVFMKEGLEFPGEEVEMVVKGAFGFLIRDRAGAYIVLPNKEVDWSVRPRIDRVIEAVVEQDQFLEAGSPYGGLLVGGCMRAGKSSLFRELGDRTASLGKQVLFIRPGRARKVDKHLELARKYPALVELRNLGSVDDIKPAIDEARSDLVIFDEMNLLIFAPSGRFTSVEEKAKAIAGSVEAVVNGGRKFVGGFLDRFATGEAFPPIHELLALQRQKSQIEYIRMYAQCVCGAIAEVPALTELWHWQGQFTNGTECVVRPLVPIDQEREAIENFYGPLCSRCHHLIHGELAPQKWANLDFSRTRDFTAVDLF